MTAQQVLLAQVRLLHMPTKFVLFDAFGTLLTIPKGRHPYRQILKEGIRQGRRPRPDDLRQILTRNLDLIEAAKLFGIKIQPAQLADIQGDLETDMNSIEAYADGLRAVETLQAAGIKIAIASNLASPYADAVRRLYPSVDACGFSFALGAMKPEPFFYRATCELLGADTGDYFGNNKVVMIGDSPRCDRDGPRAVGIRGVLLNRQSGNDFRNLVEFSDTVLSSQS
ncbi:TPA: HAD family hydrolase [Pseudomonas aeruginosa]|uniref:HAD family hydrolase n=1 Tax=Pseudomonas aeruginosa TaxID=287 RepID=UPI000B2BDC9B|nr:HAD family hydrolase [Pseudomonas aeruginosa]MCS8212872.1 HAD family hydrolase [Pseudomonas aeruginosa]MCS8819834.1 HAD family hydrolase [Pseudomonas aeruginosa]